MVLHVLTFQCLVRVSENAAEEAIMILFSDSDLIWIFNVGDYFLEFRAVHQLLSQVRERHLL